jgi:hypothetical protein
MKALLIGAALLGAAYAVPATAQAPSGPRQCFAQNQMGATKAPDDSTLNIRVMRDVWQLKMASPCNNLNFNTTGIIFNLRSGTTQFCGPIDFDIATTGPGGTKCFPESLRKLTPEEMAALPVNARP